jgi:hypothetical protein
MVHKVDTGGFRMFESIAHPGKYIRLKDGEHSLQDNQVINISQMYYGTLQRFKSKNLQGHFHSSPLFFLRFVLA